MDYLGLQKNEDFMFLPDTCMDLYSLSCNVIYVGYI